MGDAPPARVTIDPDLCIGSAECVRIAPGAFRIDERRGVSTLLPGASAVDAGLLAEAAHGCPTRAITLRDGAA